MKRRKTMKPKTRSAAKALLRMGQNKAEVKRRLRASGVTDDDLRSAEAEVQLESGLSREDNAALAAIQRQMLPPDKLPKSGGGPTVARGPYKKSNPQKDLSIIRRRLRKGLPLDERAEILISLAKDEDPGVSIKALSLINDLDALTHASKAQGERPAPGPMWILPADALPSVDPVHIRGEKPLAPGLPPTADSDIIPELGPVSQPQAPTT